MKSLLLLFALFIISFSGMAQKADTTLLKTDSLPKHSPTKATLMSLVLPGLGQAYNKKYWKIPLVYTIIGLPLYFGLDQNKKFDEFKSAYVKRVDNDPLTLDVKYQSIYSDQNMLDLIDYHRKNRDLFFVLTGIAYALNVLDAAVDAHLFYFDVSDDISGVFRPNVQFSPYHQSYVPSIQLTLKIGKKPNHPVESTY